MFNHRFPPLHVFTHWFAIQHEQEQCFFFIKCGDTALDHRNAPLPVAHLITNSLPLVKPLAMHLGTFHEFIVCPSR